MHAHYIWRPHTLRKSVKDIFFIYQTVIKILDNVKCFLIISDQIPPALYSGRNHQETLKQTFFFSDMPLHLKNAYLPKCPSRFVTVLKPQ